MNKYGLSSLTGLCSNLSSYECGLEWWRQQPLCEICGEARARIAGAVVAGTNVSPDRLAFKSQVRCFSTYGLLCSHL